MNRRFTQEEQPSALAATTQEENRPDFGGPLAFDKRAFRSEIAQRVHKFTDPTYKRAITKSCVRTFKAAA